MLGLFLKGGIIMWPILALSIVSLSIIMDRFYSFFKARLDVSRFLFKIENFLRGGKKDEALYMCEKSKSPVARICAVVIDNFELPYRVREEIFSQYISAEIRKLGKNVRFLGIIGHVLPLLGLFGTVVGMIKAFMAVENAKGAVVNPGALAGGIWEALLTTAAGLAVAIPTLIIYHYLEGKLEDISLQMNDVVFQVEGFLREVRK
ncbi:MotA/TolQ/ExbB proton channel family protein [Candidatus Aerophobetes bacterium]|nr:MotA/TolQ/ExbB proton channel family protein [Candidatus Aerophobetes bacterium]